MLRIIISFTISALMLVGCSHKANEAEILQKTLQSYYDALLYEDLNETMAYYHSEAENLYKIAEEKEEVFRMYNYSYKIESFEVVNVNSTRATTKSNIRTSGIDEEFGQQESYSLVYTYSWEKNQAGEWKIISEEISPI